MKLIDFLDRNRSGFNFILYNEFNDEPIFEGSIYDFKYRNKEINYLQYNNILWWDIDKKIVKIWIDVD